MKLPDRFDGKSLEYQTWKTKRLQLADQHREAEIINLAAADKTSADNTALGKICNLVRDHGFAIYQFFNDHQFNDGSEEATVSAITDSVQKLHACLSLTQADQGVVSDNGLSLLKDMSGSERGKFIPYSSKAMGWHTDGYYNDQTQTLRCFTLHCISPAASGGTLSLIDNELFFIALCDQNPELIELLSHPQAMTLPANKDNLGHDRPDRHAAVFFCQQDGSLGTRYTARTKNIIWRTTDTQAAAEQANEILGGLTEHHHHIRLQKRQGMITRNILHRREAFTDNTGQAPRQILRGRYLQLPKAPITEASHATCQ